MGDALYGWKGVPRGYTRKAWPVIALIVGILFGVALMYVVRAETRDHYELREDTTEALGTVYPQGLWHIVDCQTGERVCFFAFRKGDGSLEHGKDWCFALNAARRQRTR